METFNFFRIKYLELIGDAVNFIKKTIREKGEIKFDLKTAIEDELEPLDQININVYDDMYGGETDETTPFLIETIESDEITGLRMDGYSSSCFPCEADEYEDSLETIMLNELPNDAIIQLADIVMNHYKMND